MGTKYYLAVDIGASSGRHMLAHLEDGYVEACVWGRLRKMEKLY